MEFTHQSGYGFIHYSRSDDEIMSVMKATNSLNGV